MQSILITHNAPWSIIGSSTVVAKTCLIKCHGGKICGACWKRYDARLITQHVQEIGGSSGPIKSISKQSLMLRMSKRQDSQMIQWIKTNQCEVQFHYVGDRGGTNNPIYAWSNWGDRWFLYKAAEAGRVKKSLGRTMTTCLRDSRILLRNADARNRDVTVRKTYNSKNWYKN